MNKEEMLRLHLSRAQVSALITLCHTAAACLDNDEIVRAYYEDIADALEYALIVEKLC